jgi:uncharacterized membrane protein YbhN (UPF0104 family)
MSARRALAIGVRLFAAGAVIALCAWGLRRIEWRAVGDALVGARVELVLLAAAINFLHIACKSERWRVLLASTTPALPGRLRLYHYLIVSYAASVVLPARAGEGLRVVLLRRNDQVPVSASIGVLVVEKLFEGIGLLAVVAPLPLLLDLPRWAKLSVALVAAIGVVATTATVLLARHARPGSRWERLGSGLQCVRDPRTFVRAVAWSIVAYATDLVEVMLILRAVNVVTPWPTAALVLLTLNLAIALPSTPGHVGAFEAGAVAGLSALGVRLAPALAFALVYHVMQVAPVLLAGLSGLRLFSDARKEVAQAEIQGEYET